MWGNDPPPHHDVWAGDRDDEAAPHPSSRPDAPRTVRIQGMGLEAQPPDGPYSAGIASPKNVVPGLAWARATVSFSVSP